MWLLRVAWTVLPLTAGPALATALDQLSGGARAAAEVLCWSAWAVGVLASFAPRPVGLTALRVLAPVAVGVVLVARAVGSMSALDLVAGVLGTLVAAGAVLAPATARAFVQSQAYGDEQRVPLRTPPVLLAGPLELAVAAIAAGVATGPLLLAEGRWLLGAITTVAGLPLAAAAARSLHVLARRIAVTVPAGLVVVDPMSLADPVLVPRDRVRALEAAAPTTPVDGSTADLRLGAVARASAIRLATPVVVTPRTRRGATVAPVEATCILFAPVERAALAATL